MARKVDYYPISYAELLRDSGSRDDARDAVILYSQLKESGVRESEISYSRNNGYRVVDPYKLPPLKKYF